MTSFITHLFNLKQRSPRLPAIKIDDRIISYEELIDKEDYIYLNYKDAIKEKLYDSSITFERYKELYLLALKRKTKANNYQRKSSLRSDIDVKKKKSLW